MAQQVNVVYADHDNTRAKEVTDLLLAAGFALTAMTADTQHAVPDGFGTPDVVLLCESLEPRLRQLTRALWPRATVVVLSEAEDYRHLPRRLKSMFPSD